jgi:hypothetical protein
MIRLPFMFFALAIVAVALGGSVGSAQEPWSRPAETAGWAAWRSYYQEHARIRLGPEQRLANGIAWRLHTDTVTGVAWPRITWMPNARHARTANEFFDMAQGGALMDAMGIKEGRDRLRVELERLASKEIPHAAEVAQSTELSDPVLVQQEDALLTYASENLASVVDFEEAHTGGMHGSLFFRAITFDLARGEMHYLRKCGGSPTGHETDEEPKSNFFFEYGPLLRICDQTRYDAFKRVYEDHAKRTVEREYHSAESWVKDCATYYADSENDGDQEILLYLTMGGLAVQRMSFRSAPEAMKYACPSRSAINPTIIPYRDIAFLMESGPWRDELLALRNP